MKPILYVVSNIQTSLQKHKHKNIRQHVSPKYHQPYNCHQGGELRLKLKYRNEKIILNMFIGFRQFWEILIDNWMNFKRIRINSQLKSKTIGTTIRIKYLEQLRKKYGTWWWNGNSMKKT